jgi:hypothetical protein
MENNWGKNKDKNKSSIGSFLSPCHQQPITAYLFLYRVSQPNKKIETLTARERSPRSKQSQESMIVLFFTVFQTQRPKGFPSTFKTDFFLRTCFLNCFNSSSNSSKKHKNNKKNKKNSKRKKNDNEKRVLG